MKSLITLIFSTILAASVFGSPFMGRNIKFLEEVKEEGSTIRVEDELKEYSGLKNSQRLHISWSPGKSFTDNHIDVKEIYEDPSVLTMRFAIISNKNYDGQPFYTEWDVSVDENFKAETSFIYTPKSGHILRASFGDHSMIMITLFIDEYLKGLPSRDPTSRNQRPNSGRSRV
ncbi:MAG: hypothetical protein P1U89_25690 [Verrucomicrobiales bacterium]|nr:hypothetical protein [Verrucomicrobiales bacterium]